jgi:DNA-binding NtrC family response regulator
LAEPPSEPECEISDFVGLTLAKFERRFVEATISECNGSVPEAARLLDVSPSTIYRKLESWKNSKS